MQLGLSHMVFIPFLSLYIHSRLTFEDQLLLFGVHMAKRGCPIISKFTLRLAPKPVSLFSASLLLTLTYSNITMNLEVDGSVDN